MRANISDQPAAVADDSAAVAAGSGSGDPIASLIHRLASAADTGSPLSIGGRARVTVCRVPGGISIERGAGR